MSDLPKEMKLTTHAKMRLLERKSHDVYNLKDLMLSSVKWYSKNDLIDDDALYRHACYTTRKSNQLGYITDGDIEVIYNMTTNVAITVLEVKDKFKPITQYIKPEILSKTSEKENEEMNESKSDAMVGTCPDCGNNTMELITNGKYAGLCETCANRKRNMTARGREYIPYLKLSKEEKHRIDVLRKGHAKSKEIQLPDLSKTISVVENYYQMKAENNPDIAHVVEKPITMMNRPAPQLSNLSNFIKILREHGCEIPEESLNDVLNVLANTDKLKDIFMTIAKSNSQDAMLDLEQALNVVERKLQHNWEFNGFQEADDIKFKEFLTWRRMLKGAIFFWKKLYQTNCIIEIQRAWNAYTQDPNDKIVLAGDKIDSSMKRYQVTTDSISTIFNTRRPFTRVFYATDKDMAYNLFKQWMADRNLHEDPKKTTIIELKTDNKERKEG